MQIQNRQSRLNPLNLNPLKFVRNQEGRIGYLIAWLLGVPASLLFLIFLIRGH